jgi:6-pyruvoyltetrahydropterin/6-carboxytetrahydropterin synthase
MFTIAVRPMFEASHEIPGIPDGYQRHGRHTRQCTVDVRLTLTHLPPHEGVVEVVSLVRLHRHRERALHDRHLNDGLAVPPSLPHLARHLYAWCRDYLGPTAGDAVRSIRVSTDPDDWASYTPDGIECSVGSVR